MWEEGLYIDCSSIHSPDDDDYELAYRNISTLNEWTLMILIMLTSLALIQAKMHALGLICSSADTNTYLIYVSFARLTAACDSSQNAS